MPQFDDGELIATIQRNATEQVRVRLREYKSVRLLDVRQFYDVGSEYRPTGKGVSLRVEKLPELIEALQKAQDAAGVEEPE